MNRLYYIRHGENLANITKEFSSRKVDHSLTEKGVLQAQQTAEHFDGRPVNRIFSSPLKRAKETATIIGDKLGLEPVVLDNFREIDVGTFEGEPVTDRLWDHYRQIIGAWREGKVTVQFPGGDNYVMVWDRVRAGLEAVFTDQQDQHVIIVGHGGSLSATLKDICVKTETSWYTRYAIENCSITEIDIEIKNTRWNGKQINASLVTYASHDHLHGSAADLVPGVPSKGSLD